MLHKTLCSKIKIVYTICVGNVNMPSWLRYEIRLFMISFELNLADGSKS